MALDGAEVETDAVHELALEGVETARVVPVAVELREISGIGATDEDALHPATSTRGTAPHGSRSIAFDLVLQKPIGPPHGRKHLRPDGPPTHFTAVTH